MPESMRSLWNALLTSTSGRDGRLLAISIRGDGPMFGEMADLAASRPLDATWIEHAAPADAELDDEQAWRMGNPGLETGIKDWEYMRRQANRAVELPKNAPNFQCVRPQPTRRPATRHHRPR